MNAKIESLINIDQQSPLPINIQIKEQIKLLISNEVLSPGDDLPSTNQLADHLAINRNTIQWVYSQLKDDGLLIMQKGRGTRIADEANIEEFKRNNPYYPFVQEMMTRSSEASYHPENLLLAGFAYLQLYGKSVKTHPTYLFIECKVQSCYFYLNEIVKHTSAEILSIDIDAPESELLASIRQADVIVTTTERSDRVRNLQGAAGKTIITVGDPNDVSLLLRLIQP
ncbi:GntR family transcriptional regulator [Paenibacillus aestuarii]|uniref:GntR family transcriptional regulator n=1 Tax=Paenibacillus aestuarii TaxID=516965 RepID=A0ABW0KAA4_9BACL|nr:GntR family transcriptional regulator [Paenibacillus aestuarii]